MEDALKAQAAASPVADRIRFVGRVPHSEVDHYYSLIDILAYPRKKMRLTDLVTPLKPPEALAHRQSVVRGTSVSVRLELGCRLIIKKQKKNKKKTNIIYKS